MNSISEKWGAAIAAVVIGGTALVVALGLKISQNYSDFVVGSLAWYAGDKFQDLIAWPAFILFAFLAFLALTRIGSKLQRDHGADVSSSFMAQLVLWSLPFYASAGTLLMGGKIDEEAALISVLGIVALGLIAYFRRKNPEKPDPTYWSAVLLLALLISFIPIAIAVSLSKAPLHVVEGLNLHAFTRASKILLAVGLAIAVYTLSRASKAPGKHLPKFFLVAQIALPLFFLTLLPAKFVQPSGEIATYRTTEYLTALLAALVAYGIYDVIRRFQANSGDPDWKKLLSPFALIGLVVAYKAGPTVVPYISGDDYHFGEHVLGWWTYLKGYVPYVDYIPSHGILENDFRLFLSYIFYDGTAVSVGEAGRLALVLLAVLAFLSVHYFTGSIILAFAVTLLLGGRLAWFFFIPFICLWLSPSLRVRPARWLAVWMITSLIVILGVPPQGTLLVAAFGLLAVKIALDLIRFGDKRSWQFLGLIAAITLLLVVATPLLPMLVGAIRYVLENGPINQIAYGIPWALSSNAGSFEFIFDAIRMSWVAVPILCLYVILSRNRDFKDSTSIVYPALVFLAFSLLLIPYSMGRIDFAGMSRPGLASTFGWAVLFPILMWGDNKILSRAFVVLAAVFMSAVLGLHLAAYTGLSSIAAQKIPSLPLKDSDKAGLPNIGHAYVEETQWNRINRLKKLLDSRLAAGEPYLDLTSRNAHYFYLNRAPVMPVTAPFNMVPAAQQKRAVEKLTAAAPKLALLQADNIVHDGGGLALRNPYLYRFAMDHYVPRLELGFIVGYLKSDDTHPANTTISAEIKDVNDQNWLHGFARHEPAIILTDPSLVSALQPGDRIRFAGGESRVIEKVWSEGSAVWFKGAPIAPPDASSENAVDVLVSPALYKEYVTSLFQRAFSVSDLQKIPVSWGKSESSLRAKMNSPVSLDQLSPQLFELSSADGTYRVEGNDPRMVFDISGLGVSGKGPGLLKFDFECIGQTAEPRIQIFWWGDERNGPFEQSSLRFTAENGNLIVPLDASPWWAQLHQIKGIRVDLDNAAACSAFKVNNVSLYQRG